MQNISTKIKEIVLTAAELNFEQYKNYNLSEITVSSIQYIKIIVAIEQEFEMEFGDECLLEGYFTTFEQLADYVLASKKNNNEKYNI